MVLFRQHDNLASLVVVDGLLRLLLLASCLFGKQTLAKPSALVNACQLINKWLVIERFHLLLQALEPPYFCFILDPALLILKSLVLAPFLVESIPQLVPLLDEL